MDAQIRSTTDPNHCSCDDCIAQIATVAPASNYERREIRRAERLTGVHMPDSCRGCPHAGDEEGWDGCCGGAV